MYRTTTKAKTKQKSRSVDINLHRLRTYESIVLLISHCSAHRITQDWLGFHKVCARWVQNNSQESTNETNWQFASHHCQKVTLFWDTLSLETRRGFTITLQKANARVRNGNIQNRQSKRSSKFNHPRKKWRWHFSWGGRDALGPILKHYQERGTAVNKARCSEMLRNQLKPAIRTNRQALLSKVAAVLQDNVRPHMTTHTIESLRLLNFEVLKHPPYGPEQGLSVTCLAYPKTLWVVAILPVTKKWTKRCMRGLSLNQKRVFSLGAYRSFWTARLPVLKRTETV
jgi:hypothetical protein